MSQPKRTLDLGCGNDKLAGAVGMDSNRASAADVIHDLDDVPWPFETSSFDHVRAQDVLEHVDDFIAVVTELHRVCKNGATIDVRMPFMSSVNYATDPTHRRPGTFRTFDYFDPSKDLAKYSYSRAVVRVVRVGYERGYLQNAAGRFFRRLDKLALPFIERNSETYEAYFAYVYPVHNVSYQLRVEK